MKRLTGLAFLFLLLLASLAGAAPVVSTPADSAHATLVAIFAAPPAPDAAQAMLPSFAPEPTNKAVTCGSCSDSLCQGKTFNTICKTQGTKIYKCQPAYAVCAPNDCECWTGPLP